MTKITVRIVPNNKGNQPGKLADAELYFEDDGQAECRCGGAGEIEHAVTGSKVVCSMCNGTGTPLPSPLAGLKLIGFSILERRTGTGRDVTFPARQYSVNGERRSFALLRPIAGTAAQDGVRDAILAAYDAAVREASS